MSKFILFLIVCTVNCTAAKLAKPQNESHIAPFAQVFKCSENVYQNNVNIPESLQAPMTRKTQRFWDSIYTENLFKFDLVSGFECPSEKITLNLMVVNDYKKNFPVYRQFIQNDFYWTPQATLKVTQNGRNAWLPTERYCISEITTHYVQVQVCQPECNKSDICIPKCCAANQVLSQNGSSPANCSEVPAQEWKPTLYAQVNGFRVNYQDITFKSLASVIYQHTRVRCINSSLRVVSPNEFVKKHQHVSVRFLKSGEVILRKSSNHPWKEIKTLHCIDRFWNVEASEDFVPNERNIAVVYCDETEEKDPTASLIYFSMFILSSIFALATVIIYILLWNKQNVHGWTVAVFSMCVFFTLISFAFAHGVGLFSKDSTMTGSKICVFMAVLNHFFYTAMFSWLTVLCFDLWSTISSMAPTTARSNGYKKFVVYCCFGFGVPTVVVTCAIAIEIAFKDTEDLWIYKPLYGFSVCLVDRSSFLYYNLAINLVLYCLNLFFAVLVAKSLYDFKTGSAQATSSSSRKSYNQSILYLKIFTIMGITWVFEFVSWLVSEDKVEWYWAVFDIYNILQVVAIFWVFVCKKEIHDQLCEKYEFMRRVTKKVNPNRAQKPDPFEPAGLTMDTKYSSSN